MCIIHQYNIYIIDNKYDIAIILKLHFIKTFFFNFKNSEILSWEKKEKFKSGNINQFNWLPMSKLLVTDSGIKKKPKETNKQTNI